MAANLWSDEQESYQAGAEDKAPRQVEVQLSLCTPSPRASLSKRTILRELEKIHPLLGEYSGLLESKVGYGVRFKGDEEQRRALRTLAGKSRQNLAGLSPAERMNYLLVQLLNTQEPIKIYAFTQELEVTEATIGSDLNRCEKWLRDSHIDLVRKPGVGIYIRAHRKSLAKAKRKLKELTRRNQGFNVRMVMQKVKVFIRGWLGYYDTADMKRILQSWNEWLRRRFRCYIWKQWKKPRTKVVNLRKLGIPADKAYQWGNTRLGCWRIAGSAILQRSITNEKLAQAGY